MRRAERDDSCNFGIGAMIIFISSVLVSSMILATMILIAEKLAHAPQETANDSLRSGADKIIIRQAYIWDDFDNFGFIWELSAGSDSHQREDLYWIMQCTDENGDFWRFWGDFVESDGNAGNGFESLDVASKEYPWTTDVTNLAITTFTAGTIYETSIDQHNGLAGAPSGQTAPPPGEICGPQHLFQYGLTTEMWFIIGGGGTTYLTLEVHDNTVGARIS